MTSESTKMENLNSPHPLHSQFNLQLHSIPTAIRLLTDSILLSSLPTMAKTYQEHQMRIFYAHGKVEIGDYVIWNNNFGAWKD